MHSWPMQAPATERRAVMRFFLTLLLIVNVAPALAGDRTLPVMLLLARVGYFEYEESRAPS